MTKYIMKSIYIIYVILLYLLNEMHIVLRSGIYDNVLVLKFNYNTKHNVP